MVNPTTPLFPAHFPGTRHLYAGPPLHFWLNSTVLLRTHGIIAGAVYVGTQKRLKGFIMSVQMLLQQLIQDPNTAKYKVVYIMVSYR